MFKIHAGEELLSREREILKMISMLSGKGLKFIVVGGYAVATHRHRFSVDLDIVVRQSDLEKFRNVINPIGYSVAFSRELKIVYGEKFERFKKEIDKLPVYIDILVNGLASRTTNAVWSFDMILKNAEKRKLDNIEFSVPKKELIVAMKIHSGRFSDTRDAVALADNIDIKLVKGYTMRGDKPKLEKLVKNELKILNSPHFADGFKGVFGARFYNEESLEKTKRLLKSILKQNPR